MELEEIKAFLREKNGYLKEGAKRLRNVLRARGFSTTIDKCKTALREVNQEKREERSKILYEKGRILIYDIETSPNLGWFWTAGYNQDITADQILKERAIICVSYKWLGEDQVYNIAWDKDQNDKFLVEQFIEVLNEADLIVAHNGDRFDLKWLRTRALIHGLPMLPKYNQFDTLKIARSKLKLNSNRLDYISKILGFTGKKKTSPGLWKRVCFENNREALVEMLDYCDEDVRQLENVFNQLKYLDNPRFHAGVLEGETKQTSPISGGVNLQHIKTVTSKAGAIKHIMKDLDTDRFFEMSDTNYQKYKVINDPE